MEAKTETKRVISARGNKYRDILDDRPPRPEPLSEQPPTCPPKHQIVRRSASKGSSGDCHFQSFTKAGKEANELLPRYVMSVHSAG